MKSLSLSTILLLGCILATAATAKAETALGILLGSPSGISLRVDKFPVLGVGWSFSRHDHGRFYLHCDYWIIHEPIAVQQPMSNVPMWYLGAGGAARIGDDASIGVRVPIGLQFIFRRNFELFGEVAPGLQLLSDVYPTVDGGIGLRFIF